MDGAPIEVKYYQGQRLTATLFRAEQAYHVTMRERHNLADHDWGIALGLQLSAGYVEAGYAIDGYGRELILPNRTQFDLQTSFDELGGDSLDVSLVYSRVQSGDYAVETPVIQLDRAQGPDADRRHPKVTPGDENFDATRTAPQDTLHAWPVYLGTIKRDPTDLTKPPTVVTSDRPYVGARAARVFTPDGDAHLDLGQDVAVYAGTQASPVLRWAHDGPAPRQLEIAGSLMLHGDLIVDGGCLSLHGRLPSGHQGPGWQLDHTTRISGSASAKTVEQLRLVLGTPSGSATSAEFVIGRFENGQFKPCLTVADTGTVTVHGNLIVEGVSDLRGGLAS